MLGAKAVADAGRGSRAVRRLLGAPPGHPARGRIIVGAGLLARGSSLLSGLPEAAQASVTSLDSGLPLTVAGAAPALSPASLLAPDQVGPENLDDLDYRQDKSSVNLSDYVASWCCSIRYANDRASLSLSRCRCALQSAIL